MTRHRLQASDATVRVGVIDAAFEPVLQVDSGDEVVFETWQLWGNAVTPQTTFDEVVALRERHRGRGPHSCSWAAMAWMARKPTCCVHCSSTW